MTMSIEGRGKVERREEGAGLGCCVIANEVAEDEKDAVIIVKR